MSEELATDVVPHPQGQAHGPYCWAFCVTQGRCASDCDCLGSEHQATELVRLTDDERDTLSNYFEVNRFTALTGAVERMLAERAAAARADEREWFRSALTSDVGDLLDVDWLRENWWVKHVVAEHLAGPPTPDYSPGSDGPR